MTNFIQQGHIIDQASDTLNSDTFIILQKIYIPNKCCLFGIY